MRDPARRRSVLAIATCCLFTTCAHTVPGPPIARQIPAETVTGSERLTDPYAWLRDRKNPETLAYLTAENAYTDAQTAHTKALQEALYQEFRARVEEEDTSAPAKDGAYFTYTRTEAGKQYPIHCRKRGSLDAPEEIVLDQNALARGHAFFNLGDLSVSPDQTLVAYAYDTVGSETCDIVILDLGTRALLPDRLRGGCAGLEWGNDNRTLYYLAQDAAARPYRAHRHRLGSPAAEDVLLYQEDDPAYWLGISKTLSKRYLLFSSRSTNSAEVRFVDADDPSGAPRLIAARDPKVLYLVDHSGERFYILTNDRAPDYRIVSAPVASPGRESWTELVPAAPGTMLTNLLAFKDHLAVFERVRGLPGISVVDLPGGARRRLEFPEPDYDVYAGENHEFATRTLRFRFTSFITPESTYDTDLATGARTLIKVQQVRGGYDPGRFETERIFARAPDGAEIPVSLVHRKDLPHDGSRPLYLSGYGAYGVPTDPSFTQEIVSLLERGVTFGIAHVRGGNELGQGWYEAGRLLSKKNTFSDFIAAAEHLIAAGYTRPEKLAIIGGSAGGLLIGAVLNLRPGLFRAAVARVPFVDLMNTMLDPDLPLTITEYDEWGNPGDPAAYAYMRSYSPYDNVRPQAYPHLLVLAGLHDIRVGYWEAAKWVARLRAAKTDGNQLLLRVRMESGHRGQSGRYDRLRDTAFIFAFVLDRLGIQK